MAEIEIKTIVRSFILGLFFLTSSTAPWVANQARTQGLDSCIVPYDIFNLGVPNPDSAYIDTCRESATSLQFYSRNAYEVNFDWYVIQSPVYNKDTTLIFTWDSIDTAFQATREGFAALEAKAGNFTISKPDPYVTDTASELNKDFFLRFDSLLCVDSVVSFLDSIPETRAVWRGGPILGGGGVKPTTASPIKMWPEPCSSQLFIRGQFPIDRIQFYDGLGRRVDVPINDSRGLLTADVSKQHNGVLYMFAFGYLSKILIQR